MFREHAKCFLLTEKDLQAFAMEEVRHAYNATLPQGEYRNDRGDTFTVDCWDKRSLISKSNPPQPNSIWIPIRPRQALEPLLSGYHFQLGRWGIGEHTPPPAASSPQPLGCVPACLEGATYRGVVAPMPCQYQASTYLPYEPVPGSQFFGFAAATALVPQQPLTTGSSLEDPVNLTAAGEEQGFYLPAAYRQQDFFSAADEQQYCHHAAVPDQQPATTTPAEQVNFEAHLERYLHEFLAYLPRCETPRRGGEALACDIPQSHDAPALDC